ncbi:rhomboid family intramembrane serine protease [Arsenicicoccus piscis]|uniref:Rhomboid family intramembrane serine protease n=1 Tax=Arsenicicoccus piscis TaxID=673954 RepID=A0ABQ6HUM0_9MICO|nr:rhomboid family intramembrane serine protease [Arsenicicoccus piscis]MCH8627397.1 rhomboid family intramembrane serine protease [Arsenicicoccus piscis]GMA21558.1 rhomboid family intramembrane serine protease [Arsenicicoccus piscis]
MSDLTAPGGDDQVVPTCPRHPDVISYVRCARCGRPTCPTCQRQAPVGIQCVDCVRESAKNVRRPQSPYGGAVVERPTVTYALIATCVVVYLGQMLVPGLDRQVLFAPVIGESQPWRFITAAFAHGSLVHIGFNMLCLYQFGDALERALGHWRYLTVYLISALGGSVGYLLLSSPVVTASQPTSSWYTPVVGASGAVFGLFGAMIVLALKAGSDIRGLLVFLALNGALGFILPNVAWQAHLGGLITGAACAGVVLLADRGAARGRSLQWLGLAAIAALLVAATVVKYASVSSVPVLGA